jgi:hypothetical protein
MLAALAVLAEQSKVKTNGAEMVLWQMVDGVPALRHSQ